jgi:hypothetical protein
LTLRNFVREYPSVIPPWEWDEDYPDDMYGRYFPEDINAIVQIDYYIDKRMREERDKNK